MKWRGQVYGKQKGQVGYSGHQPQNIPQQAQKDTRQQQDSEGVAQGSNQAVRLQGVHSIAGTQDTTTAAKRSIVSGQERGLT
jgi:hypothetical protein